MTRITVTKVNKDIHSKVKLGKLGLPVKQQIRLNPDVVAFTEPENTNPHFRTHVVMAGFAETLWVAETEAELEELEFRARASEQERMNQ